MKKLDEFTEANTITSKDKLTDLVPLAFASSDVSNCSTLPTLYLHNEKRKSTVSYMN